jgi:hypothetical protein
MTTDRYDVPADATVHQCEYCSRPFADEEQLALHRGLDHPERIDDEELTAFEEAYTQENDAIGRYRIIAIGAIVLLYFSLLIIYALI